MSTRVEQAIFAKEPLPGIDKVMTETGLQIAARPQFKGGIGNHVYVNGYDIAKIEREAYDAGRAKSGPSR